MNFRELNPYWSEYGKSEKPYDNPTRPEAKSTANNAANEATHTNASASASGSDKHRF
ncbi:MAG: hypothetical protein MUO64_12495 [Anaerolineales bacterium]|nr:hypothetical protein [Anaerolineales bacterium]